jgi:predicted Zn-dependent peptidase
VTPAAAIEVTTLSNGITVATENNTAAASNLVITVNAGSANEDPTNAGLSHVMKEMAFQSTSDRTAFVIQREMESNGMEFTCTNDRESITYSAKFMRDSASTALDNLTDTVVGQVFHPWEVAASKSRVEASLANRSTEEAIYDALHAGAFRSTLGRPTFCQPYKIGSISSAQLGAYADDFYTGGNITISATGVDHDALVAMVDRNFEDVPVTDKGTAPATYYGGFESRVETASAESTVAIGFEGAAAGSDAALPVAVLAELLGGSNSVKWGSGTSSNMLNGAVSGASSDATVSSFNFNYSDTGLVGVYVTSNADDAEGPLNAAVEAAKGVLAGNFTDADVSQAKNKLARAALDMNTAERSSFYAKQLQNTKQVASPEEYADALLAVSTEDVKAAANKVGASKPTVAATGELGFTPYADELL